MKTLIDRLNPMYPKDYKFRDIYLLTTAAEDEDYTPKRAESGNPKLQQAFDLGKNV